MLKRLKVSIISDEKVLTIDEKSCSHLRSADKLTIEEKVKGKHEKMEKLLALKQEIERRKKKLWDLELEYELEKSKLELYMSDEQTDRNAVSVQIETPQQILMTGNHIDHSVTIKRYLNEDMQANTKSLKNHDKIYKSTAIQCNLLNEAIKHEIRSKYVMFGTYRCEPKAVELNIDGITLIDVCPNNVDNKLKYTFKILFSKITQFCIDRTIPSIFMKPNLEFNGMIQNILCLSDESNTGFKLDINSTDEKERYICMIMDGLSDDLFNTILLSILHCDKTKNEN